MMRDITQWRYMIMIMKIEIKFNNPTNGYWDGGAKSGGVFESVPFHQGGVGGIYTSFGCWELNFHFNVRTGKNNKETVKKARAWLKRHCRVPFTWGEVSYE